MAQTQLIKRRIRSVGNTRQITKAMELVAASRMRRAQEAALRSRAYAGSSGEILARLSQITDTKKHPLFSKRRIKLSLTILITSDRGLAGAYNNNLLKIFADSIKDSTAKNKAVVIGQKGARFVSQFKEVELIGAYTDWPNEPTSHDIRPISQTAIDLFTMRQVDNVEIIFTDFISSIRQQVRTLQLLPITSLDEESPKREIGTNLANAVFEPSPLAVLEAIVPKLVEARLYQTVLEASASEQSMRMMAMKNATDNANDLIDDLTLAYNGARQAGITQELAEISAGAEAIT